MSTGWDLYFALGTLYIKWKAGYKADSRTDKYISDTMARSLEALKRLGGHQ